jgi:hypothetical protein
MSNLSDPSWQPPSGVWGSQPNTGMRWRPILVFKTFEIWTQKYYFWVISCGTTVEWWENKRKWKDPGFAPLSWQPSKLSILRTKIYSIQNWLNICKKANLNLFDPNLRFCWFLQTCVWLNQWQKEDNFATDKKKAALKNIHICFRILEMLALPIKTILKRC